MATATKSLSKSDFAPEPKVNSKPEEFPRYTPKVHGFAEIKKHNIDGIRGGLEQLADHRRAAGSTKRAFLITYRYKEPVPSSGPLDLDALVLEPYDTVLKNISPIPIVDGKRKPRVTPATKPADPGDTESVKSWLNGLGTWYSMGSKAMKTFSSSEWLSGKRASGGPYLHPLPLQPFGHMAEVVMRDWFLNMLDQQKIGITDITQNPLGSGGADVSWQEIAEYLYELANELAVGAP